MKKYDSSEIKRLYSQGYGIRAIQRKLGISSPSVVQWHVKHITQEDLIERIIELETRCDRNGIY